MEQPSVIFVSGLSGSGKTTAMAALEDQGFYCVDNLPALLVEQFLDLCDKATPRIARIALALDARETQFLSGLSGVIDRLREAGRRVELLFLECSIHELEVRYRETRRVHPLSPDGSVERGVEIERRLLADVSSLADQVLDTTQLNVHELRDAVVAWVSGESRPCVLNVLSFGFRYGTPESVELLFDVRFLPNPYFEAELREGTGLEARVSDYVIRSDRGRAFMDGLQRWLDFLLPLYDAEGKAYLTLGIGCTGGRHRSVSVAEAVAQALREGEREVNVRHRDVEKAV